MKLYEVPNFEHEKVTWHDWSPEAWVQLRWRKELLYPEQTKYLWVDNYDKDISHWVGSHFALNGWSLWDDKAYKSDEPEISGHINRVGPYKGFYAHCHVSIYDNCLYGKIIFDPYDMTLATFESDTLEGLKVEFEKAVDDYLENLPHIKLKKDEDEQNKEGDQTTGV
jgi:hypothetical protein